MRTLMQKLGGVIANVDRPQRGGLSPAIKSLTLSVPQP